MSLFTRCFLDIHYWTSVTNGFTSKMGRKEVAFLVLVAITIFTCLSFKAPVSSVGSTTLTRGIYLPRREQNLTTSLHRPAGGPSPSLLCVILTAPQDGPKTQAVNQTWVRRCDKALFVYGSANQTHENGDKLLVHAPENRKFLTSKVKEAFKFVHKTYMTKYEWILKADVDTYVIVENLKLLLSQRDPKQSVYMGCHFKKHLKHGFMSGGAGYILSARALNDIVDKGFGKNGCQSNVGDEDVEIAKCLELVNATAWSSLDQDGKQTFNAEPLGELLSPPHPQWLNEYQWNQTIFGSNCCGETPISFHHVKPREIYVYEHMLYKAKVHTNNPADRRLFQDRIEMAKT